MDSKIDYNIQLYLVGSVSSIVGYGLEKATLDVDSFESLEKRIITDWNKACDKLNIDLKLNHSAVFYPPDQFTDRYKKSDISTKMVSVYFMEKHDFVISKLARGWGKDIDDIVSLHKKSPLDAQRLIDIFFDEYIFVQAVGHLPDHIITLKEIIFELFGEKELTHRAADIDRRFNRK